MCSASTFEFFATRNKKVEKQKLYANAISFSVVQSNRILKFYDKENFAVDDLAVEEKLVSEHNELYRLDIN